MAGTVEVREPADRDEYRAGLSTISAAWRAGFDDIVSEEVLSWMDGMPDRAVAEGSYDRYTDNDAVLVLVAVVDDGVIGTGSLVRNPAMTKPFVSHVDDEIRTLYVDPNWWGDGVGTRLLAGLCDGVRSEAEQLVLETLRDNERGRRFYEARGFEHVDDAEFTIAGETYPTVVYERVLDDE